MNVTNESGWLKPKMEGVGHVTQADEKDLPPEADTSSTPGPHAQGHEPSTKEQE